MEINKINEFLEKIILGKFLIHFLPGFILYLTILDITDFKTGNSFIYSLFNLGIAWTLGVFIEILFFKKAFDKLHSENIFLRTEVLKLLIAKISTAILFSLVFWFF